MSSFFYTSTGPQITFMVNTKKGKQMTIDEILDTLLAKEKSPKGLLGAPKKKAKASIKELIDEIIGEDVYAPTDYGKAQNDLRAEQRKMADKLL